jgi:hypothetical protein
MHYGEEKDPTSLPVNSVDNKLFIEPEAVIQLALSNFRHDSRLSDAMLAQYIVEVLAILMDRNKLNLVSKDVRNTHDRFRILLWESKDLSQ